MASVLIGVSLAAVAELVTANTFASTKLTNKIDGQLGASRALRRISSDIRQARIIGNINASYSERNKFPSSSKTEIFSVPPSGGWPSAPWMSTPYFLGPRTLVIQQPSLFKDPALATNPNAVDVRNGFPLRIAPGLTGPDTPSYVESVNTIVYHLIPDSTASGQYILQVARFVPNPAGANSLLAPAISPPQTVLKGIVGPLDPADPSSGPCIFQYLTSPVSNTVYQPASPGADVVDSICGVSVNLEVQSPNSNQGANKEINAVHMETFMKTSKYMRFTND